MKLTSHLHFNSALAAAEKNNRSNQRRGPQPLAFRISASPLIAARVHIIAKPLVHLVVAEIGYIEAVRESQRSMSMANHVNIGQNDVAQAVQVKRRATYEPGVRPAMRAINGVDERFFVEPPTHRQFEQPFILYIRNP